MSMFKRVIGVAALVLPMLAGAEEVGQVSTVFKFLGRTTASWSKRLTTPRSRA